MAGLVLPAAAWGETDFARANTVRILMTGITGTPMPAYWSKGDDKAMLWEVAWYVETLAAGEATD